MKNITKAAIFTIALLLTGFMTIYNVSAKDSEGDIVIVIDPGHGGDDPGSITAETGVSEKDCNLAIALAMKDELGKYDGVKVYLTRSGDQWVTNSGRAMIASSLNADFLISIHNNSGSESNSGCIGYRSLNEYYSESTGNMCALITENLSKLGFVNGGVQTRVSTQYDYEDYYTIIAEGVRAGVPSVIIEHCFLSNAEDAAKLTNTDGTVNSEMARNMGEADADAVVSYFNLSRRTAKADSATEITLVRGTGIKVEIPGYDGSDASWQSSDESVVTVESDGEAKAVGIGTARVSYSLSDGTSGYIDITVPVVEQRTLTGAINPTFYDDVENLFTDIDLSSAFGVVTYSDGTAEDVNLDSVDEVDYSKVGIQQVKVKYGELTGRLMVCHNTADYKPEVTAPVTDQPSLSEETETTLSEETSVSDTEETTEPETDGKTDDNNKGGSTGLEVAKFIVVIFVLAVIAMIMAVIEKSRQGRRGGRR